MLYLDFGGVESFNDITNEFTTTGDVRTVRFEHSLKSVSLWEAKYKRPYLVNQQLTTEEGLDYLHFMALDPFEDSELTNEIVQAIADYKVDSQTATTIKDTSEGGPGKVQTAETIYAMMFISGVPIECENWHINRLFTLLRVIGEYKSPKKQMTAEEIYAQNRKLNEERTKKVT